MTRWDRLIGECKKDLKQWLFFMFSLSFFRAVFIIYFKDKIEATTSWIDVVKAFVNGLRYDGMAATYFVLLPLLLSVISGFVDLRALERRVRTLLGALFNVLTTALAVVTLVYFKEYNDQFNHFIFNLYYDDTKAIFSTIWAGYHVIPNLLAIALLSTLLLNLHRRFMTSPVLENRILKDRLRLPFRVVACVLFTLLCTIAMRGSYGHRTAKLEDAAVTPDVFLNKAVLNPYSSLMYAYGTHRKLSFVMGGLNSYIPDGNVKKAAQALFHDARSLKNLDDYLKKTASGHRNRKPKHIFLVVMESYDAWPLLRKYASLGLTKELAAIAQRGIYVKNFLPASDGTASSLSALVSGLPDANVVTNYQKTSEKAYPSSIAESFKRLGYRTRFFYGGYLSWQKIGDFMKSQGFEDVYGAAHIGSWASHNEWGVEDESLFNFIVETVSRARSQPSLNVIMTTSYHPPYELDVYKKGFPLTNAPDDLASEFDGSVSLKMLGHLWYSDRCIGDFVRSAELKFDDALFAFTGDHFGRKYINLHPGRFEASAVPFVLYGKKILRNVPVPPIPVGSHIDIAPTLIELSAPKGFVYYSIGRDILRPGTARYGVNRDNVIGSDFLFDVQNAKFYPLPGKPVPKKIPDPKELTLVHDRETGIAWWRIVRGATL
jgi:phosphoglycerol transferase MdoB-like AlkP superfamily enzyme